MDVLSVSTFVAIALLSIVQLLEGVVSPNLMLPSVRALSRWTTLSAARLRVLKSARASTPAPTWSADQLLVLDQLPPAMVRVQVPLTARARRAVMLIATATAAGWMNRRRREYPRMRSFGREGYFVPGGRGRITRSGAGAQGRFGLEGWRVLRLRGGDAPARCVAMGLAAGARSASRRG